jgi:fructose-1,6-bisphosphatase I
MTGAAASVAASSQLLFSGQRQRHHQRPSFSPFPIHPAIFLLPSLQTTHCQYASRAVRCMAVDAATAASAKTAAKSSYELVTLTTWLLKQEQAGSIDAELTIVLSSISMACKQIASLVQRAGISNLTGVQGAVNVQGEDQKKLDVVSNEVISTIYYYLIDLSQLFKLINIHFNLYT